MKSRPILFFSIILNLALLTIGASFVSKKGGINWVLSQLSNDSVKTQIPILPLPDVTDRILMLGDSHLAIHPWSEYSDLPFANRAVSGSQIHEIEIDHISGTPSLILVSTSTNDLQKRDPLEIIEISSLLENLFQRLSSKWPDSKIIYIAPPDPNVKLYENYIRKAYPDINRPLPTQIEAIRNFVSQLGVTTLKGQSASFDGLHLDAKSARKLIEDLKKIRPQLKKKENQD